MELSINFIVMFILAVAMFATGVVIMRSLFSKTDDIRDALSDQQRSQLERLLVQSPDKVKAIYTAMDIEAGERDVLGIGIRNDFDNGRTFYVMSECDAVYKANKEPICDPDAGHGSCAAYNSWMFIDQGTTGAYNIESNDIFVVDIFAQVPKGTERGTYIFNIRVCTVHQCNAGGTQYDTTKKLSIKV